MGSEPERRRVRVPGTRSLQQGDASRPIQPRPQESPRPDSQRQAHSGVTHHPRVPRRDLEKLPLVAPGPIPESHGSFLGKICRRQGMYTFILFRNRSGILTMGRRKDM